MSTTTSPVANPDEARRARREIGAMFFVAFGGVWLALGASRFLAAPLAGYVAIAAVTLFFFWLAWNGRKQALLAAGPLPKPTADDRRRDRWFNVVNAGQGILIFVAANVLVNVGLGAWVIPAAMFIVGAHFLPLAALFAAPSHYVTGAALMALACFYPLATAAGPASGSGPVLAGLVLWTSAGYAIRPTGRGARTATTHDEA